jgi:hypothetical protein
MKEELKQKLFKASNDLDSTRLIYFIHFNFGWPAHSLKIKDVELFYEYNIPCGWDGIGEKELEELEKEGVLKKISELVDELDPLEKRIEYEILVV